MDWGLLHWLCVRAGGVGAPLGALKSSLCGHPDRISGIGVRAKKSCHAGHHDRIWVLLGELRH